MQSKEKEEEEEGEGRGEGRGGGEGGKGGAGGEGGGKEGMMSQNNDLSMISVNMPTGLKVWRRKEEFLIFMS